MKYHIKPGWALNPNEKTVEGITAALERNNGECPCDNKYKGTEDAQCPCRAYREEDRCCCSLYVRQSIEDRAKAYAEQYVERYQVPMFKAYIESALAQREMDINRAWSFFRSRLAGEVDLTIEDCLQFRKFMEE